MRSRSFDAMGQFWLVKRYLHGKWLAERTKSILLQQNSSFGQTRKAFTRGRTDHFQPKKTLFSCDLELYCDLYLWTWPRYGHVNHDAKYLGQRSKVILFDNYHANTHTEDLLQRLDHKVVDIYKRTVDINCHIKTSAVKRLIFKL